MSTDTQAAEAPTRLSPAVQIAGLAVAWAVVQVATYGGMVVLGRTVGDNLPATAVIAASSLAGVTSIIVQYVRARRSDAMAVLVYIRDERDRLLRWKISHKSTLALLTHAFLLMFLGMAAAFAKLTFEPFDLIFVGMGLANSLGWTHSVATLMASIHYSRRN